MLLFVLAYLGGVLTIVSPCILPVLPFVFGRAGRAFWRSTVPMLLGMAVTFAGVATLAAVGGGWAVEANRYGRVVALGILALFGITLIFPLLAARLAQPLVGAGARLSVSADRKGGAVLPALLLGGATGLLWALCAGPILGLILTGAALQGASVRTSLLLLAYAAGGATSLALALLVGGRVLAALKRSLGASEWVRRGIGVAVLVAVCAIALGVDTGFLTEVSSAGTSRLEQGLLDRFHAPAAVSASESASSGAAMSGGAAMTGTSAMMSARSAAPSAETLSIEGTFPSLAGATQWLNSPPLAAAQLRGKVVLVDFWTYSCINCLRAIPYVRAWADKYRSQGLVVIGVHAPEFAFEKRVDNVRKAVADLQIDYPVAVDNDYAIWRAFKNEYWPAHYFIDAEGRIRHHHFGEGEYAESERVIQQLLAEAGRGTAAAGLVQVQATGAQMPSAESQVLSPETYVGYERAERFVSPSGAVNDGPRAYTSGDPRLNEWGLAGTWTIGREHATLAAAGGSVVYRFHARDLHLVLGPAANGKAVRFQVTLDGQAPGDDHGVDVNAAGEGVVTGQRLYQLIRQQGAVTDHTFEIRFLDPGVEVFAFTFG